MKSLYVIYIIYLIGVAIEFCKTMKQMYILEEKIGYITNELKLTRKELIISTFIISLFWIISEVIISINTNKVKNNK